MREQIANWQQRLQQAWSVRMQAWQRNQAHFQAQLEMLNPQRTLERGYAVVLNIADGVHAVRDPSELQSGPEYEIRLAKGAAVVKLNDVKRSH
jgi:exodeoxyribonuclease VII large subunit